MKNIYRSLLLAAVACLPLFTSCDDDNDSNPTISFPETFVLNTPEFAANNVYDILYCFDCVFIQLGHRSNATYR